MVEVFGLIEAITLADECLKTSNINLIGIEKVSSGLATVKITGDIGAVTSAIDLVKRNEKIIATSVIPNIDNYALNILNDKSNNFFNKTNKKEKLDNEKSIDSNADEILKQTEEVKQNLPIEEIKVENKSDGLEEKTVKELIEILIKSKKFTYTQAKKMRKEEIINKIRQQ